LPSHRPRRPILLADASSGTVLFASCPRTGAVGIAARVGVLIEVRGYEGLPHTVRTIALDAVQRSTAVNTELGAKHAESAQRTQSLGLSDAARMRSLSCTLVRGWQAHRSHQFPAPAHPARRRRPETPGLHGSHEYAAEAGPRAATTPPSPGVHLRTCEHCLSRVYYKTLRRVLRCHSLMQMNGTFS
jgi:hypothetical protein